ncbi:hypothetical protein ACFLV7_04150 [Chloroflexota bacterium]
MSDIPFAPQYFRKHFHLQKLLERAHGVGRANWQDIPKLPGIYAVYWPTSEKLAFQNHSGQAQYATTVDPMILESKWNRICQYGSTDIIYIGKGDNLKKRIRYLIRFGIGVAKNHEGGEWMWQISNIAASKLMIQTCPKGKQIAFENALLEKFYIDHDDFPLANRKGTDGVARWMPHPEKNNRI